MKILILATDYAGDLLYNHLEKENNECYLINPYKKENGLALLPTVAVGLSKKPEVCLVCSNQFEKEVSLIHKSNIPVLGHSQLLGKLENDQVALGLFCKAYNLRLIKPTTKTIGPLSTEIWFSRGEPLYQYFGFIKQDRFLAGDMGPIVDGESVLMWGYKNRNCEAVERLFNHGLFKFLETMKYTGPLTIDCSISSDDLFPYVRTLVSYFRLSSLVGLTELLQSSLTSVIISLIEGKTCSMLLEDKVSLGVKITEWPYPFTINEGFIKYISATDYDWKDARKKVAQQVRELDKSKVQFRIDGGNQGEYYDKFKQISYLN